MTPPTQTLRNVVVTRSRARRATGILATKLNSLAHEPGPPNLSSLKLRAIDVACGRLGARTLADLGAVWAVHAGYTFYAADRYALERAVAVDDNISQEVRTRTERTGAIELIQGNFSRPEIRDKVGRVDALLLFDILLHQVDPNWDDLLKLYADSTDIIVIAGPQYESEKTTRLIDLGRDEYVSIVPKLALHDSLFDRLDEVNEDRGRPWRDVHDVWQWGIVDADLRRVLEDLGFSLVYYENVGPWQGLRRFANCSYVFARSGSS